MGVERLLKANPWWSESWSFSEDPHLKELENVKYKWDVDIESIEENGIYVIRGPRQTGKTTWIKRKIKELSKKGRKKIFYFSCDILSRNEFNNLFYELEEIGLPLEYLFFDEVGYIKDWQIVVKHHWDRGFLRNKKIILTGSTSLDLKKGYERMPGRKGKGKEIFFYPASFYDFVKIAKGKELSRDYLISHISEMNILLEKYLLSGGFPISFNDILGEGKIKEKTYETYIEWVSGDAEKAGIGIEKLISLGKVLINSLSNTISWQEISRRIGVESHHTSNNYVEKLEKMFLVNYIYNSITFDEVQQRKNKKFYFLDPFLFWVFYGISYGKEGLYDIAREELRAKIPLLVENTIFSHLLRFFDMDYQKHLFYYKSKKEEIDFYIKKGNKTIKIESKFSSNIKKKKDDVVYITKDSLGKKEIPASIFLYLIGLAKKEKRNIEKEMERIQRFPF